MGKRTGLKKKGPYIDIRPILHEKPAGGDMRFLLLGDHPDGVALAETLARDTSHEFAAFAGPSHTATRFAQQGFNVRTFQDTEDALALPEIDMAIVADEIEFRPAMLRRALQSEKHVLCVHPADLSPDIAYEAMMIQ